MATTLTTQRPALDKRMHERIATGLDFLASNYNRREHLQKVSNGFSVLSVFLGLSWARGERSRSGVRVRFVHLVSAFGCLAARES